MPRFFIDGAPAGGSIRLTGEDAHHLSRVLRLRPGDSLTVCDGAGTDYACVLEEAERETAICRVLSSAPARGEPRTAVTLYMGLPKGDKMDFIVQKTVELGVGTIVPCLCARSVSRPDERTLQKKTVRWQKIAREAAMQCGRGRIPQVAPAVPFAEAVRRAAGDGLGLFLYENERETGLRELLRAKPAGTVSLLVGPEGGFADEEAALAAEAGLAHVTLGPRILRCETAPLAALTAVLYEYGDL